MNHIAVFLYPENDLVFLCVSVIGLLTHHIPHNNVIIWKTVKLMRLLSKGGPLKFRTENFIRFRVISNSCPAYKCCNYHYLLTCPVNQLQKRPITFACKIKNVDRQD